MIYKIKSAFEAVVFVSSLMWIFADIYLMFNEFDLWGINFLIIISFTICSSCTGMFKNAMMAGWIEFQEDEDDADSK